jgi:hypothetical protein
MWAMRRSAESRVRESSEGGRIGPDLDLARLFIAALSCKQRRPPPSRPCHATATLPSILAPRTRTAPHAPLRVVAFAGRAGQGRSRAGRAEAEGQGGRGGDDRYPRTNQRLFMAFTPSPPNFSAVFCLSLVGTLCLRDTKSGHLCDWWLKSHRFREKFECISRVI